MLNEEWKTALRTEFVGAGNLETWHGPAKIADGWAAHMKSPSGGEICLSDDMGLELSWPHEASWAFIYRRFKLTGLAKRARVIQLRATLVADSDFEIVKAIKSVAVQHRVDGVWKDVARIKDFYESVRGEYRSISGEEYCDITQELRENSRIVVRFNVKNCTAAIRRLSFSWRQVDVAAVDDVRAGANFAPITSSIEAPESGLSQAIPKVGFDGMPLDTGQFVGRFLQEAVHHFSAAMAKYNPVQSRVKAAPLTPASAVVMALRDSVSQIGSLLDALDSGGVGSRDVPNCNHDVEMAILVQMYEKDFSNLQNENEHLKSEILRLRGF